MKSVTYILIPGLGDKRPLVGWFYHAVAGWWTRKGMRTRVVHPGWRDGKPYQPKSAKLAKAVDEERALDREVVLVGISAGAALGLLMFSQRRGEVLSFISVCGFTQLRPNDRRNSSYMRLSWYQAADKAEQAAQDLSEVELGRILSLSGRRDGVIDPARQRIEHAANKRMWSSGHLWSILVALTFYRRMIDRFVTSKG